jgi:predicted transcriptional regulator
MTMRGTSFRLSDEARDLLQRVAGARRINQASVLEMLIRQKGRELKIDA